MKTYPHFDIKTLKDHGAATFDQMAFEKTTFAIYLDTL
jgi:hypothetical protein